MPVKHLILSSLLSLALLAGCNKESPAPEANSNPTADTAKTEQKVEAKTDTAAVTPEVMKEAQEIFSSRCTPCHGPQGKGDGPASAGLTPPPRNFTDKAWQSSVSDEHIEKIIQYGGAAVGKSPAMPPNPDLADKPVVKGLREHIRSLGK